MKKVMLLVAVLSLSCLGWADSKKEAATDRLENASKVLTEIMGTPDKGIPEEVLEHAKCVAVVPHMLKGGLGFGCAERQRRGDVPDRQGMERTRVLFNHRR